MLQTEFTPGQRRSERQLINVVWMTSGLGCDGDTVSLTAATSPSLEELLTGAIPGTPAIVIYNPMLAFENGDELMRAWYDAERGRLDPFVLVLEGSVPNEEINGEGHWAGFGVDPESGQPITTCSWVDRLAPKAAAVMAIGTCAAYGGVPAMRNNPTGAMGLRDYLGWNWASRLGIPIVNLPGCPVQPNNITETLLALVLHLGGLAPIIDLDDQGRPRWLFDQTVHETCNRAGFAEAGGVRRHAGRRRALPGQTRVQGTRGQVQRAHARLGQRDRRLPQRRRHLHRVHRPRVPRPLHAVRGPRPSRDGGRARGALHLRPRAEVLPRPPDAHDVRTRAGMAPPRDRAAHRPRAALVNSPCPSA